MNAPFWVVDLAERFWKAAGAVEAFPRKLECAAVASGYLSVLPRKRLTVNMIRAWLAKMGIAHPLRVPDRPLRACLVACEGSGFAFIDATDSEDERRFSLAHELAHFLRDYLTPRETAARRIGSAAAQVQWATQGDAG